MVDWVYILLCTNNNLYIGTTNRQLKRIKEHLSGKGSVFTRMYKPIALIGLYRVGLNIQREELEDYMTLHLMWNCDWTKVRGGRYTGEIKSDPTRVGRHNESCGVSSENFMVIRPNCKCGLPCEEYVSANGTVYYRCSMIWNRNGFWTDKVKIGIGVICDYMMKKDEVKREDVKKCIVSKELVMKEKRKGVKVKKKSTKCIRCGGKSRYRECRGCYQIRKHEEIPVRLTIKK